MLQRIFNNFRIVRDRRRLCRDAARLASCRPLEWYPGWRLGIDDDNADPRVQDRLKLWRIFNQRGWQYPIIADWHAGLRVHLYLGNDMSRCQYVGGCYEPNEFKVLNHLIKPGMTCIDAGANEGLFTLFMAKRVGNGRVMAIEPSQREYRRLLANLRLNHLRNVTPVEMAVSDRPGRASLRIAGYEHEGLNTIGQFVHQVELSHEETVEVTTIDDLVSANGLKTVDIMKLDVEGTELKALLGARETLGTHRPYLLFEASVPMLQKQGGSLEELLGFLRDLDYQIYDYSKLSGKPEPLSGNEKSCPNLVAAHPSRPWPDL